MSIIERIRQIQTEEKQKHAEKVAAATVESQKNEAIRLATEEAKRKNKEVRENFVIQQTNKIMSESGILENLQKIDQEILKTESNDHFFLYDPKQSKALLIWGYGFTVSHSLEVEQKYSINDYQKKNLLAWSEGHHGIMTSDHCDFGYILVTVDPDTENLTISRDKLNNPQWKDKELIETILLKSYLNPLGGSYTDSSSRDYDTSPGGTS